MGITQRVLHGGVAASVILTILIATACASRASSPTQPGRITVSHLTATSATLGWTKSKDDVGVVGYLVYRGPAAATDANLTLIESLDVSSLYSATRLYSGTAYKFGIQAIDASNNKSALRTVRLTTLNSSDMTAPVTPTRGPALRAFSDDRIDLTWPASTSPDVAGYEVLRDGIAIATIDQPGALHYSDNGLAPSTSYSYAVKAKSTNGLLSAASPAQSANTLDVGTVRIARGPLVSTVDGTSGVISWWTCLLYTSDAADE